MIKEVRSGNKKRGRGFNYDRVVSIVTDGVFLFPGSKHFLLSAMNDQGK